MKTKPIQVAMPEAEFSRQQAAETDTYESLFRAEERARSKKQLYTEAQYLIDRVLIDAEELAFVDPIACKKGCSGCCSYRVGIGPSDAKRMASALRSHPERSAITEKLKAQAAYERETPSSGDYDRECAFLAGGDCSIYEARPLACRAYFSSDPEYCVSRKTQTIQTTDAVYSSYMLAQPIVSGFNRIDGKNKSLAVGVLKALKA